MDAFLNTLEKRLTEEEKVFLSDIFAPREVAVPDRDPGFGMLTATRDGDIRLYGVYNKKTVFDTAAKRCYLASDDAGLSWKRHFVPDGALGASCYLPFYRQYLSVTDAPGGLRIAVGDSPDDPAPRVIFFADNILREPTQILPLREDGKFAGRVLITAVERRPEEHPTAFYPALLVTDDLKSFRKISLGAAPMATLAWPHKGYRWQQNNRECTIAELSDGRLWMLTRTSTDFHYQATSEDGGDTWGDFSPSPFHSMGTMPRLLRLSDGRLLFFFCNTAPMPEREGADGVWEDYFTNRDACHVAISEDDGKTFFGFREIRLNPHRDAMDFRSKGGPECDRDKSVHQFEAMELPMGKVLVVNGQHTVCRRAFLFDVNWLYETGRREDFIHGAEAISLQTYVESVPDGYRAECAEEALSYVGHCAYNRQPGAFFVPSPANDGREALWLPRLNLPHLLNGIGGAVWNFPAAKRGKITLRAAIPGKGLRVSLLDHWRNPSDDTVAYAANLSFVLRGDMQTAGEPFTTFVLRFDCEARTYDVSVENTAPDLPVPYEVPREKYAVHFDGAMRGDCPFGLCYLHLQAAATEEDLAGALLGGWEEEVE